MATDITCFLQANFKNEKFELMVLGDYFAKQSVLDFFVLRPKTIYLVKNPFKNPLSP